MMKFYFMNMILFKMIMLMKNYKFILHNLILILFPISFMNLNLNEFFWTKIYYIYGIDTISMYLILLNCWISSLAYMSNNNFLNMKFNLNFILIILCLNLFLNLCFSSNNMFLFYIFFESSLIPLVLLIMGWGLKFERIQSSMYLLFYTLFGSLPMMCFLILMFFKFYNLSIIMMMNFSFMFKFNNWLLYMVTYLGFLIKTPTYFFHLWLPKAHVEAPISGSMILAGIMLKIGTYGIYRMIFIFFMLNLKYSNLIISMNLLGSIFSCLICLKNTDLKSIIAYSSIVHMNMMVSSMFTMSYWSLIGSIWMMMAHGICSSGMFCYVNIIYKRSHTRNILINKGLLNLIPSMSLLWFLICTSNFSAPPSLNLFSEIMLINGLISWLKINLFLIMIITFFSSYYSIYLFSFSQHSNFFKTFNLKYLNIFEYLLMFLHWFPLNLLFLSLNLY